MTRITKEHKSLIAYQMDRMARHIKPEAHLPLDTFLNLFFTAKQREQMDAVSMFVDMKRYDCAAPRIKASSYVPDDLPLTEDTDRNIPSLTLFASSHYSGFHPSVWRFHPNAHPDDIAEFDRCVEEVTTQGRIAAMWADIQEFYVNKASSHEEMRYLFPGTVSILRRAALDGVANTVENVHRRPPVTADKDMMAVFRYMNQWFATHVMLETFDSNPYPLCGTKKDPKTVTLHLAGFVRSDAGVGNYILRT